MKKIIFLLLLSSCAVKPVTIPPNPILAELDKNTPVYGTYKIIVACDSTCTNRIKQELIEVTQKLNETEQSACFEDFFMTRTKIVENKGLDNAQLVQKIKNTDVKTTLSVYYPNILARPFHKECGFEADDGKVHLKDTCWLSMDSCSRAAFIGHESTHILGFTHQTAGNQAKGNENTVPYLVNQAFSQCCGK